MTSTPVKGAGSLMNFIGNRESAADSVAGRKESFGAVMNKATGNEKYSDSRNQMNEISNRTDNGADRIGNDAGNGSGIRDDSIKQPVDPKTGQTQETAGSHAADPEDGMNEVKEAGDELVKEVAGQMGLSEEEVRAAMELLGLTEISLFDAKNMTQLLLSLSGEGDSMALLTNENLYGTLQDLLQTAQDLQGKLMQELQVSPEEMSRLLDKLAEQSGQTAGTDKDLSGVNFEEAEFEHAAASQENTLQDTEGITGKSNETLKNTEQITVTVEENGKTVELTADENGNTGKVKDVIPQDAKASEDNEMSRQESKQGQHDADTKSRGEGNLNTGNPLLDALLQNKNQAAGAVMEQAAVFASSDTKEIMNQILDYMKIQLKPGMDQLEMQLHPANLGTLRIQITAKAGEVTAQFQVQNEAVKAAIESQMVELKEALKEQGVRIEAVEVTVESHSFESNLWQGQEKNQDNYGKSDKKSTRRINLNDLRGFADGEMPEEEALAAKMMEANGNTVDYMA